MRAQTKLFSLSIIAAAGLLVINPKLRKQVLENVEEYGKVFSNAIEEGRQRANHTEEELHAKIDIKKVDN